MKKLLLLFVIALSLPMLSFSQNGKNMDGVGLNNPIHPSKVSTAVYFDEIPSLMDLPTVDKQYYIDNWGKSVMDGAEEEEIEINFFNWKEMGEDPVWQKENGVIQSNKALINNFAGQNSPYMPSDCNGTVGPNHFMQTVNTTYAIYNKAGTLLAGPTAMNTLFAGVTGAGNNDGDPLILFDEQADKWVAVEFSLDKSIHGGTYDYMLVAVSQTNDPTGAWWRWSFTMDALPDYEKMGIWHDGYYMGTNLGSTTSTGDDVYVFERSVMIAGGASPQQIQFHNPNRPNNGFHCIMPLDADGANPPASSPGQFITINDDAWGGSDELRIYELVTDWGTPSNSTFSMTQQLPVSAFDSQFNAWGVGDIAQPGTSQEVSAQNYTLMTRGQYKNWGTAQSVVCTHTVDVDNTNHAGMRWYELEKTSQADGTWAIRQQGTYAPDAHSRFNGNIAINNNHEIALGYNISSSSKYADIRYVGQSASTNAAASGIMDLAESADMASSPQSQTSSHRWGDYPLISLDPSDGTTFWYTNEYYNGGKKTRIISFTLDAAVLTADFSGSPTNVSVGNTVTYTDASFGPNPITSWNWSFPGGTPSSATGAGPHVITYNVAGTFDASLTVGDGSSTDDEIKSNYINASYTVSTTYTAGDIPTDYDFDLPSENSACPGLMTVTIPSGATITGVDVEYDMSTDNNGYMSEQRSELRCTSTGGANEGTVYSGSGNNGTFSYSRTGLSIANGVSGGGNIDFEIHAGRTWGGSGCNTTYNMVDNNTWTVTVHYTPASGSAPVAAFSADDITPNVGQTVTFTDASTNTPTSWSWSFSPATVTYVGGTSSTSQNPQVTFDAAGAYDVTLTATNGSGSDDEVKASYITASTGCAAVTSYPYVQNFDSWTVSSPAYNCTADGSVNLTDCWTNVTGDDIDWDILSGATGSSSTGPTSDHTGSGNYLYTESSGCYSKTAYITSPEFDLTSLGSATLTFWYHMYGGSMGTLSVQVSTNGGSTWSADLWSLSGDQGNSWQQASISLDSYVSSSGLIIRFTGLTGTSYTSDMAIDDVEVDGIIAGSANNTCAGATAINEVTDLAFDTSPATASGVQPSCGGSATPPIDLWYAYTATFTGNASIDLCGSSFDTRLTIWDACGGTEIACNDDACGLQSTIEMSVTNGTTYYVQVGGYNTNSGTGDLTIEEIINDDCASAIAINEVSDLAFDTGIATASGVQPSCGGSSTPPIDLWYAYTATFTGNATIDLCGSSFDTRLTIWDACGGTEIACNDDACGLQSTIEMSVTNGTTYYVQVGGFNTATGVGDLTITPEYTWSGATDSDWATVSNWASGVVPNENVEVVLSSGASNYPILNGGNFTVNNAAGTYKCKSLLIQSGAQVEVYQGLDMLVYGDVTVESGGTLLLGDDLDIQAGGNLIISGGTVANNYNYGNFGDIFFRDGSTGSMTGGTLTAYDQMEFYNTTFSATGGEIHCGGTNDEVSIIVQTNPTNLFDFIIDADCRANLTSTSNNSLQVNNFTAEQGSSFTIAAGETVQVNGNANFEANASGMASFIQDGSFTVNGTVDYQQYLTQDNWHQVASPISNALSGNYMDIYLYDWSEADSLYTWHSVVYYPLNMGEGYYVWNPSTAKTVHFDGAFNNSDFNRSLSYTPGSYTSSNTTGYNLVGNPFPSYLTYDNSWSMTNVDATFYVMNSATGNYVTMNPNISTEIIPPTQGFFVKANAASASVTIPAASRTHTRGVDFYKGNQVSDILSLEIIGNGSMDKISILAKEDATYDFDNQYDAYDLRGLPASPQLYMPVNGINYSMNVIPNILESDVYPIAVEVGKTNQYEIKLLPTTLSDEFSQILLEDIQMQTTVNLNETNYLFVANQDDDAHRFNLRFSSPNGVDESFSSLVNVFSLNNTIIVQTSFTKGEITVYDMLGQKINTELILSETTEIEMQNSQAYYLVEVKNNEQVITKKVYLK